MQDDDSEIRPIAFLSRTFSGAELNYDVHDKELLAIYEAFRSWHHFGINKTLALIRRDYVWPNLRFSVTDYCRSCTTCSRSRSKCHKPYGLLRQLPVPVRPWDSISMDFIEQLPTSSDGFTAILVVVDRFTKQSIC